MVLGTTEKLDLEIRMEKKQSKIFITFSGLIQQNPDYFFCFGVTIKTTTNSNNFSGFLRIF
jgi:hypothetical protein